MNVWLSTIRRGIAYHAIRDDGRFTFCGRPSFAYGHHMPLDEALEVGATECRTCRGDQPRWKNPELRRAS